MGERVREELNNVKYFNIVKEKILKKETFYRICCLVNVSIVNIIDDTRALSYIGQQGWFEAGKVGEKDPVPTSEQHILCLDVTMTNFFTVTLLKDFEQLEHNPLLLHHTQEGTGTERERERKRRRVRERERMKSKRKSEREKEELH